MKVRGILNIILINLMIFFALVSIHEMSHAIMSYCLGCEYEKAVLFDSKFNGPHTEFFCSNKMSEILVYSISLIITTIFSLGFIFLDSPERNMFFISLGISITFSSSDIGIVFNTQTIFYPLLTAGFFLITAGEYFMAFSHIKEDFSFDFLRNKKNYPVKEV